MKAPKKVLALALSAVLMGSALAGCGNDTPAETQAPSQPEGTTLSGTVNTDGSTSMADVMAILTETYKELQPDVTINYTGSGSGSGINGVLSGTCDIGLSSRELSRRSWTRVRYPMWWPWTAWPSW